MEKIQQLDSLQSLSKAVRLQDKLCKRRFHEDMKKLYEPMTDIVKDGPEDITKTKNETSINNSKGISDLNENVLDLFHYKGMIAPYLTASLVNIFKL